MGDFTLHSGSKSDWIIDCRELQKEDWEWAAHQVAKRVVFSDVYGVPEGGLKFAEACRQYRSPTGPMLIVDDVLTDGNSMEEAGHGWAIPIVGYVLFDRTGLAARSKWINALWSIAY